MYRLGVLISGRGSNFRAITEAVRSGFIDNAEVCCVVSNNRTAKGLEYARANSIRVFVEEDHGVPREEYDGRLIGVLKACKVDFVLLAGFMRILTPLFVRTFQWKILNIHPSLLPAFRGLHAQRQALEAGVKITGATVHFVTDRLDDGPIVVQSAVPVFDHDDEESLSLRILKTEHKIYPVAVKLLVEKRLEIVDNRVFIKGVDSEDSYFINPFISGE